MMPLGEQDWVSGEDLARDGRVRLFCLPHAGSGTAGFHRWKRMLPERVAVCPIRLPGRETRRAETPMESAEEMVRGMLDALSDRLGERPYAVFGHSMGALLAFALVQAIEEAGTARPARMFCSGREGPQVSGGKLSKLDDEAFLDGLTARYGAQARALMEDAEMRAMFLPVLRADLRVVEGFQMRGTARLRCGISAFAGREDQSVSDAGLRRWAEVSGEGFRMQRFPGGHFYTFGEGQGELVRKIGEELNGLG